MDADLRQFLEGMENRLREYIDERTHDAETRIVRAFGAYQDSATVRFRKIEADVSNVNSSTTQQMDAFQAKLLELETRIINLERPQHSAFSRGSVIRVGFRISRIWSWLSQPFSRAISMMVFPVATDSFAISAAFA